MKLRGNHWLIIGAVVGTLLLIVVSLYRLSASVVDHKRVYTVGFGGDRPLHFVDEQGKPNGLAVGIVREAARRARDPTIMGAVPEPGHSRD